MQQETPRLEISDIKEIPEKRCINAVLKGKLSSRMDLQPLDDLFYDYRAKGVINFVLDFAHISFICSTSISKFVEYLKDVEYEGGKIIIYAPQREVFNVLKLVSLHNLLQSCLSLEEALKKL